MNILILGGSGFIGINLIYRLLKENINICVYDKNIDTYLAQLISKKRIKFIKADFIIENDFEKKLQSIDCVIDLIHTTIPTELNEMTSFEVYSNLIPSINFFNAAVKKRIKKIIFISSGGKIYGNRKNYNSIKENAMTEPVCPYGITKLAIEKFLKIISTNTETKFIILRPSNPYGINFNSKNRQLGLINVTLNKIIMGETLNVWGDGTNYRDYIYIGDLTEAISRSITLETKKNYLINIGTGYGIKIIDLVRLIEKITLKKIDINFLPPRTIDVNFNVLDIGKAKKILKWEPKINIEQGIKITWDWLKKI